MSEPCADRRLMARAIQLAERGLYTTGTNPRVGCVLARDGQVVGEGWHVRPGEGHAEVNALRRAGAAIGNYRLPGAELYVTLEPCVMCAGAMVHARLTRVIYGCADPAAGAAGSMANILQTPFLNHRCGILAGVLESECRGLMMSFFEDRRGAS